MKYRILEHSLDRFCGQRLIYTGDMTDDNPVVWETMTTTYTSRKATREAILNKIKEESFKSRVVEEFEL